MDCRVEILTRTNGEEQKFAADAEKAYASDGKFSVCYRQDGDRVSLTVSASDFEMHRKGAEELYMRFAVGEKTALRLRAGEREAEIPLVTEDYSLFSKGNGCSVELRYALLFPDFQQLFSLSISIQKFSED